MLKGKKMFLNVFMTIRLIYFLGSLNFAGILTPGREFFSFKIAQFPLTFMERN